jgi:hypothetical protein
MAEDPVAALQSLSLRPDLGFDGATITTAEELLTTISKSRETPYSVSLVQAVRAIYKPCALRLLFLSGSEERDPRLGCSDLQALNASILCLRVLRNLCAQGCLAQTCVLEHSGVHRSLALLLPQLDRLRDGTDYWADQVGAFGRASMQLLINLVTDNAVLCATVHQVIGNKQLHAAAMFAKFRHDAPLIRLVAALVYNLAKHGGELSVLALLGSRSQHTSQEDNDTKASSNSIGSSPVPLLLQAIIGEVEPDARDEDAFDLICWFHGEVLQHGPAAVHALLTSAGPSPSSPSSLSGVEMETGNGDDGVAVTPEQVIVLKTLHSIMGLSDDMSALTNPTPSQKVSGENNGEDNGETEGWNIEDEMAMLQMRRAEFAGEAADAAKLVDALLMWLHKWLLARTSVRDAAGDRAEVAAVFRRLVSEATATLTHLIGHFSSIVAQAHDESGFDPEHGQVDIIRKRAIGSILERLDELNRASVDKLKAAESAAADAAQVSWADTEQSAAAALAESKTAKAAAVASVGEVDGAFGERSGLVRVIANLVFRNKIMQDQVRNFQVRGVHGGVQTVLSSCNYDEESPLLREWGLLAVRNLCELNDENQKLIASLRMDGVVQHPVVHKAGYKLEMPANEGEKPVVSRRNLDANGVDENDEKGTDKLGSD